MTTALAVFLLALAAMSVQANDIVASALNVGKRKTLARARSAAGLIDTLKPLVLFTVFAPTDAAFAKIPNAQLDTLLADKATLSAVLTDHVVPGKVMAKDVKAGMLKAVQGTNLNITTTGGVRVKCAKVTAIDIVAANGFIHGIDSVVMPKRPIL